MSQSEIGVYYIRNKHTGEFYVGSTANLTKRIDQHIHGIISGTHHNVHMVAWNSDSLDLAVRKISCKTREFAYAEEQRIINENLNNPNMINIGMGVYGGDNLTRHPDREEIVNKIVSTARENVLNMTPVERAAVWGRLGSQNGMYGKSHTESAKLVMSVRAKERPSVLKGRKLSTEHRRQLSENAKKRTHDKNPFYGRRHSEKTRKLLSNKNKGNIPSNALKIIIGDVIYSSASEAARAIGCGTVLILHRVRSKNPRFAHYNFLTETPND